MSLLAHHVPGRIRVKVPTLKKNDAAAKEVRHMLQGLDGVTAVETSALTGSIVVHYGKDLRDSDSILSTLRQQGYLDAVTAPATGGPDEKAVFPAVSAVGEAFGKALFGALVEKVIERSALALVAALI
jgi:Heavy metal associated domain 2